MTFKIGMNIILNEDYEEFPKGSIGQIIDIEPKDPNISYDEELLRLEFSNGEVCGIFSKRCNLYNGHLIKELMGVK